MLEFFYITIPIFVWPYCLVSACKCWLKLRRDQRVIKDQKQLYICHISNILIFTFTWVPYTLAHFLDFAFKFNYSAEPFIRNFFLSLIALTPLLYTMTRVLCDPSLKQKLMCNKPNAVEHEFNNLMDSMIDQEKQDKGDNSVMLAPRNQRMS